MRTFVCNVTMRSAVLACMLISDSNFGTLTLGGGPLLFSGNLQNLI